jgi:hypothetical protein
MLAWIVARGDDSRVGSARTRVHTSLIYSDRVKVDLVVSGVASGDVGPAADLNASSSHRNWSAALQYMDNRVLGLAYITSAFSPSVLKSLTGRERAVFDYWLVTDYNDKPIVMVDILEAIPIQRPQTVQHRAGGRGRHILFGKMTSFSFKRLVDAGPIVRAGGFATFEEYWNCWAAKRNIDLTEYRDRAGAVSITTALLMPSAHGVLCCSGVWTSWGFPYLEHHERRGQSYHLGKPLWGSLEIGEVIRSHMDNDTDPFAPSDFADVAETLRQCVALLPGDDNAFESLRADISQHVHRLQSARDHFLLHQARLTARAYQLDVLVTTVLMSGLLREAGDMGAVLDHAIDVVIPEPKLREYLKGLHKTDHRTLGRSAIHRHRLTLHMAFCLHLQDAHEIMLQAGPVVCWRTLDLSPQAGFEWMMHGVSMMKRSDLGHAFILATRLCSPLLSADDARATQEALMAFIEFEQGVPCAVGSGRAGLKYKLHAAAHSEKLKLETWRAVATTMNATAVWVGDLGEASVNLYHFNLKTMFGPWIDVDVDEASEDFDFQDDDDQDLDDADDATHGGDFDFAVEGEVPEEAGAAAANGGGAVIGDALDTAGGHPSPDPYDVDLTKTIYVAGPHHIVHNMQDELHAAMMFWSWFVLHLKHLCRLLTNKWTKDRLLRTCYADGVANVFYDLIKRFDSLVYDKRWGTAAAAIENLIHLYDALRYGWSKDQFLMRRRMEYDEECARSCNVDIANDAILSTKILGLLLHGRLNRLANLDVLGVVRRLPMPRRCRHRC